MLSLIMNSNQNLEKQNPVNKILYPNSITKNIEDNRSHRLHKLTIKIMCLERKKISQFKL